MWLMSMAWIKNTLNSIKHAPMRNNQHGIVGFCPKVFHKIIYAFREIWKYFCIWDTDRLLIRPELLPIMLVSMSTSRITALKPPVLRFLLGLSNRS